MANRSVQTIVRQSPFKLASQATVLAASRFTGRSEDEWHGWAFLTGLYFRTKESVELVPVAGVGAGPAVFLQGFEEPLNARVAVIHD